MAITSARFTSVRFANYKALRSFSVSLEHTNILVGANNAGKSTILSAFRILAEGIRRATSRKAQFVSDGQRELWAYPVDLTDLPVSTENVFSNYDDSTPARIAFRISNGNSLVLVFPSVGSCVLIPETQERAIRTPSDFVKCFPVDIAFVPVLGPVDHREPLFKQEAARRALLTHGASRNFRNIWYHYPDDFAKFRALVETTWPGMDIEPPQVQRDDDGVWLVMFCPEKRYPREIYWAGFGFQVWCQMLTYLMRADEAALLVIDEPDIYLHSDLQRQLLAILESLGPDILIATHSTEIISEAEPRNILLVQKGAASAKRLASTHQIQAVFGLLGSNANPILTQLAKTRRVLFVEGKDFQLLGVLAKRAGKIQVSTRADFAVIPVDGFDASKARTFAAGFELALGTKMLVGVIFDRDYRSDDEVDEIQAELGAFAKVAHIHRRKELENYVLEPSAVQRAIEHRISERRSRVVAVKPFDEDVQQLLDSLASSLRPTVFGQYLARRSMRERSKRPGLDPATINEWAVRDFDQLWSDFANRMALVPGKDMLALLNQHLQDKYEVSVSALSIAAGMRREEIAEDIRVLLEQLDLFRKAKPPHEDD